MKRTLGLLFLILATAVVSGALGYAHGEMHVKENTRVVIFDMRKGGFGPFFGDCAFMANEAACATRKK